VKIAPTGGEMHISNKAEIKDQNLTFTALLKMVKGEDLKLKEDPTTNREKLALEWLQISFKNFACGR